MGKTAEGGTIVWELVNERSPDFMLASARIRVFDASGDVITTVATPSVPTAAFRTLSSQDGPVRLFLNYSAWPEAQLLANEHILLSPATEPLLQWYDLSGELVRQVRLNVPTDVTNEDRAAVEMALDRAVAVGGDDAETWRMQRARLQFADQKAPWSLTRVDDAGYLWLFKTFATARVVAEGQYDYELMVVSPEGEYLGDTTLPTATISLLGTRFIGGHLLTIVEDPETGEAIPTVYRLRSAVEGFTYR